MAPVRRRDLLWLIAALQAITAAGLGLAQTLLAYVDRRGIDFNVFCDPEAMSEGIHGADALSPELISPETTVFTRTFWGAVSKYLSATDYTKLIAKTSYLSRDQEVETWSRNGLILLRLTAAGKAICFDLNGEVGVLNVQILTSHKDGIGFNDAGSGNFYSMESGVKLHMIPGYDNVNTAGARFTFGCSGFDIYAKFNDLEFIRFKDYRHVEAGAMAIKANDGYGFRRTIFRGLPEPSLYSQIPEKRLDARDWGARAVSAKGSIGAGSRLLILNGSNPFKVGDQLIVEIGTETGRGQRGTEGVGGSRPAELGMGYYREKKAPKSLVASIIAVDELSVALSKQAVVSADNANVHFDNSPIFDRIVKSISAVKEIVPNNWTLHWPRGQFAFSNSMIWNVPTTGQTIEGLGQDNTVLFSPMGVPSAQLSIFQAPQTVVRNLHLLGNARNIGFGLAETGFTFPCGVAFDRSNDGRAEDLMITDAFWMAVGASYASHFHVARCKCIVTDPLRHYVQWMFQASDSTDCTFEDCEVDSAYLTEGFEGFRSDGIRFIRPVGRNASMSMNSTGNFLIQDAKLIIEGRSQYNLESFHYQNPIVNINSNIQPPHPAMKMGGVIENIAIACQGYINSNNDLLRGVVINENNPNVIVNGGTMSYPNYAAPSIMPGACGVNSTGANTQVRNLTVIGRVNPHNYPGANIAITDGAVINCSAELITIRGVRIQREKGR
jgi:hypothetical protein